MEERSAPGAKLETLEACRRSFIHASREVNVFALNSDLDGLVIESKSSNDVAGCDGRFSVEPELERLKILRRFVRQLLDHRTSLLDNLVFGGRKGGEIVVE
jgi:hypothetical protein